MNTTESRGKVEDNTEAIFGSSQEDNEFVPLLVRYTQDSQLWLAEKSLQILIIYSILCTPSLKE